VSRWPRKRDAAKTESKGASVLDAPPGLAILADLRMERKTEVES
jgi:hypothetical protein